MPKTVSVLLPFWEHAARGMGFGPGQHEAAKVALQTAIREAGPPAGQMRCMQCQSTMTLDESYALVSETFDEAGQWISTGTMQLCSPCALRTGIPVDQPFLQA